MNNNSDESPAKTKRNLPGMPDPDAEVIALSPRALMATNRFVCEICNKGFQRDQNLQLHRRGHNLPCNLRQRTGKETRKRVYICPEPTCVHHDPSRALGDLTGIKKHFCRKHGEKTWKCEKCEKRYAVQSDWKTHQKSCRTREYRCDCGNLFSRRDSFFTHRAFCDALAEEVARVCAHQHGGSPQSDVLDVSLNGPSRPLSGAISTPSSPPGAKSPLVGGPNDSLTSLEISKPGPPDSIPNFPSTESGIASLSSKWAQGGTLPTSPADTPRKGSRLALRLGARPGPGPPEATQTTLNQRIQNSSDSGASLPVPSSSGMSGATELMFSDEHDGHSKRFGGMMPLSTNAEDTHQSLFPSDDSYPRFQGAGIRQHLIKGIAKIPNFPGLIDHLDPGRALSSVGLSSSIACLGNFGCRSDSSVCSIYPPQQPVASAQMSATVLLQKAAQMGATASNPSLSRGLRTGLLGSGAVTHEGSRQNSLQPDERNGACNMFSSNLPAYPSSRYPGDMSLHNQDAVVSPGSSTKREEFRNYFCVGARLHGGALGNPSSSRASFNGERGCIFQPNNLRKRHMTGENFPDSQPDGPHGKSQFQLGALQTHFGLPRPIEGDDSTTVDFFGVGEPGEVAGATECMGHSLSRRDVSWIPSFLTGMKTKPDTYQSDNL